MWVCGSNYANERTALCNTEESDIIPEYWREKYTHISDVNRDVQHI